MRVVYQPVISARNVQAAPSYAWFLALRRIWLLVDPEVVFYVLVPRIGEDTRWQAGADWAGPRTHLIPVDMAEMQFDDLLLVTREFYDLFNERFGSLYFDVILTEKPSLVPTLIKLASFHVVSKSRRPLVISRDQLTVDVGWFKVSQVEELLQAVGWSAGPVIFQSPHQAKRARAIAVKHVQPSHVQRMNEHLRVFPLGIDCSEVDRLNSDERREKLPELTINYSHKLFVEQKFLESLKIMDSVFAGGRPVRLQIVTGSSAGKMYMLKRAREYAYMSTFGSMGRTAFLRQMAKAHVFISNSYYEDFSATVVEQIYTGLIPVLLRAEWSEYLVGPDYPYLFRSMSEGQAMLRYVCDHYEEVRDAVVPGLQERVRTRFDLASIVPEMVEWIYDLHRKRLSTLPASQSLVDVLDQAYDALPAEFDLPMFYAAIKGCAETLDVTRQYTESRATSPWLCADIMRRDHPELTDVGSRVPAYRK